MTTPITLMALAFVLHMVGTVLDLLFMDSLAGLFSKAMGITLLTLVAWVACTASGQYTSITKEIDAVTRAIFDASKAYILEQVTLHMRGDSASSAQAGPNHNHLQKKTN